MKIENDDTVIAFTKVKLPYGWLGNMSPFPVVGFKTAEAAFQANRFPVSHPIIGEIKSNPSPMGAKMIARTRIDEMVIEPRSQDDVGLMRKIIKMKLRDNPELIDMLKETGDRFIIEDETKRKTRQGSGFWGMCLEDDTWEGENVLGNIWMEIRSELKG